MGIKITKSNLEGAKAIIYEHIGSLAYPMDSWLEDQLRSSDIYVFADGETCVGYFAQTEKALQLFYVTKAYFRDAPALLEQTVAERGIEKILVITQDPLLQALMAEWDFDKQKVGCWFTDSGSVITNDTIDNRADSRTATQDDCQRIREVSGDFFDEVSGGFFSLEERIDADTIFVLEEGTELLGCGIIEKGLICKGYVSIGMFTNRVYRKKGVAKTILLQLKQWAYNHQLKPIAGCWFYNTLSRKSLESAGMIVTSIGYEAILKGKEKLPRRTGNPPGELVED